MRLLSLMYASALVIAVTSCSSGTHNISRQEPQTDNQIRPLIEKIDILQYGMFKMGDYKIVKADNSPYGQRTLLKSGGATFIEPTDRIPAILGTRFGFEFLIKGEPKGAIVTITRKTICPGLTNPETGQSYTEWFSPPLKDLKIGEQYPVGYGFDKEWELVPGIWTIQLYSEGKKITEKSFTVYKP